MGRRHGDQFHFTGARYQPAHHVGALHGKPQCSVLIEDKRVWITRFSVGHGIFADRACLRIELPDIAFEIGREPDVAICVGN